MEKNIVSLKTMPDLRKTNSKENSLNWTTKISIASPKITITMKLSIKMKICLRNKMINKMMNRLCTRNIMKTKMILTTITHKWLMIFHPKKEAMRKMKMENTMMVITTTTMIKSVMKPTLKTKMTTNIPMVNSTMSKVFTMKSAKATEARKTGISNKLWENMMMKLISNQSISKKDIWMRLWIKVLLNVNLTPTMRTVKAVAMTTTWDMKIIRSQNNLPVANNQLIRRTIRQIMTMASNRFQLLWVLISLPRALEEPAMKASMAWVPRTPA